MTDITDLPTTPCPPWCEYLQCREDNPADRYHQRFVVLPIVRRQRADVAVADELAVVLFTSATTSDDVWIGFDLGEGRASITLSIESAQRMHRQLAAALRAASGEA